MSVRRATALASAALGLLALAGCEKPTPLVTVTSGTGSVHDEAICYARGSDSLSRSDCQAPTSQAEKVEVRSGANVGIGVDPDLADEGWRLSINGQQLSQRPIKKTYYSFTMPDQALAQAPLELQVARVDGQRLKGLWLFQLVEEQ